MRLWLSTFAAISAQAAISCGAPRTHDTGAQIEDTTGIHQCKVSKSVERPMLVEWPATEKAALQTTTGEGVVVVRYDGCRLKILDRCTMDGAYEFSETSRSKDGFRIESKSDLFAKLPLGAASLEGELAKGDALNLSYVAVGTRTASRKQLEATQLPGGCEGATHFVRGMVVGAYNLVRTAARAGSAGIGVGPAGIGGGHEESSEILKGDGDLEACLDRATPSSAAGCQAIIQLQLSPIHGIDEDAPDTAPAPRVPLPRLSLDDLTIEVGTATPDAFFIASRLKAPVDELIELQIPRKLAKSWSEIRRADAELERLLTKRLAELRALDDLCAKPTRECPSRAAYEKKREAAEKKHRPKIDRAEKRTAKLRRNAIPVFEKALEGRNDEDVERALHFALGELHYDEEYSKWLELMEVFSQKLDEGSIDPGSPPTRDHSTSIQRYRKVVEGARCSDDLAWWARYYLADSLNDIGAEKDAAEQYKTLGECEWRKETAIVLLNWGDYLFDCGTWEGAVEQAFDAYKVSAEVATSFGNRAVAETACYKAMWAAFLGRREELALMFAQRVFELGDGGPSDLLPETLLFAIRCVERLGGLEHSSLQGFSESKRAYIVDQVATAAFRRGAFDEAERAWKSLLADIPGSLEAPHAIAGLIAIERARGNAERIKELTVQKVDLYGPSTSWARGLKADRSSRGSPTDRHIIDAANTREPPPPPRPTSDKESQTLFTQRTRELFEVCGFLFAADRTRVLEVDLSVLSYDGGDAEFAAQVSCFSVGSDGRCSEKDGSPPPGLRCVLDNGPRFYRGLGKSISARVQLASGA